MTPEQLQYMVAWARGGNEPRNKSDVDISFPCGVLENVPNPAQFDAGPDARRSAFDLVRLNVTGLLIAKLADALDRTGDVCDGLYNDLCASPASPLVKARASGFMAEIADLHEEILGR